MHCDMLDHDYQPVLYTVKSLLQARASIRIITIHGNGGGPLLEATSVRKVCSSNLSIRVAILKC